MTQESALWVTCPTCGTHQKTDLHKLLVGFLPTDKTALVADLLLVHGPLKLSRLQELGAVGKLVVKGEDSLRALASRMNGARPQKTVMSFHVSRAEPFDADDPTIFIYVNPTFDELLAAVDASDELVPHRAARDSLVEAQYDKPN